MDKLKIPVVVGSTRQGRFADKPAQWLLEFLGRDERLEVELVDLRDYAMPLFDQQKAPMRVTDGRYGHEAADRWAAKIKSADGFVMLAAEYNHGYTAVLKNALDWIYAEWVRKPVTFLGYGNAGGARAIEQLRQVAIELQMVPLKFAIHLPGLVYREIMNLPAPVHAKHFAGLEPAASAARDDLVWWATTLRSARHP